MTPHAWDGLAGGRFYSSRAWLGFCEAEYGSPTEAAVSWCDGTPTCAVPIAELTDSVLPRYRWNDVLSDHHLPPLPPAGLLVGPREGYQSRFLTPTGTPTPEEVGKVLDVLRDIHAAAGDPRTRACVGMYLTTDDVVAARRAGVTAQPVLLEADAWIEVPEGGWRAWLESMASKRRVNVRNEARRFRDAGFRIEHLTLAECCERLGPLAAATQAKYGDDSDPEGELVALRSHAAHMGDAAKVTLCRGSDNDPVGFCLYYIWGDTIFLRWAGFDYGRLAGAAEYFNVVYYSQIELAAELGVRWLHAGIKASEAKALRGAELRPLWLLDLADDSPLTAAADRVRCHNAQMYDRYAADPRMTGALVEGEWRQFL